MALALLPVCLEGVTPELSFNRSQTVEVNSVVNGSVDAVEHQLSLSPDITMDCRAHSVLDSRGLLKRGGRDSRSALSERFILPARKEILPAT